MRSRRTFRNRFQKRTSAQEKSFLDSLEKSRGAIDHSAQEIRRFRRRVNPETGLSENRVREAVRSIRKASEYLSAVEQKAERERRLRQELQDASALLSAVANTCDGLEAEARGVELDLSFATTELRKAAQLLQRAGSLQLVLDEPEEFKKPRQQATKRTGLRASRPTQRQGLRIARPTPPGRGN